MSVRRWVLSDPYTGDSYTFPHNPFEMTSPYRDKQVSSLGTLTGKMILVEGTAPAKQWTFNGPLLNKDHLTTMLAWVYGRKRRLNINDHYGRDLSVYLTGLEVVPKRRTGYYYSHDYTVTALVLAISAPTIDNLGPLQ